MNRVTLIGNLTRDPELKYTPTGTAVCTIGVATNRSWTTTTGEIKEDVQFHRVIAWQKLAELCGQILKKGRRVFVEGRIVYRTFTGKDGTQRNMTEIIMNDFIVLDSKDKAGSVEHTDEPATEVPATGATEEHVSADAGHGSADTELSLDDFADLDGADKPDDDIPF